MGDRCNIVVAYASTEGKTLDQVVAAQAVCFYGHWSGSEMPTSVQHALAKRWRWDDDSYLTRIIFDEFVGKRNFGEETGFGISTQLGDNEHPVLVVDTTRNWVSLYGPAGHMGTSYKGVTERCGWSFESFIKLTPGQLREAYGDGP